ncbi:MAG: IS982 family transposase [Acidobacteria bacterium]|nr:IS982 family transposase [Acidobacteriota bacterium]
MNSIKEQLTEIYSQLDDFFKAHPHLQLQRSSPNNEPLLTDVEVMTIALMQGYFRNEDLKHVYKLVRANDPRALRHWCSYQQWVARLHALTAQLQAVLASSFALELGAACLYVMDSKPIPLCLPIRHGRVRSLREAGAYFGKTSKGWFFGFKLHLLRHIDGRILNVILTPGNWDDREAALALGLNVEDGVVLADLGYRGAAIQDLLAEEANLLLITKADVPDKRALLSTVRQGIETTFSQLWYLFIDRIHARSWRGLWNTLLLKLIYFQWSQAGRLTV